MSKLARIVGVSSSIGVFLAAVGNVLAQAATDSATFTPPIGGGESTTSSLPNAGTSGLTYLIFAVGAMLFVYGMLRLVLSYREAN
jgi:hypothetical protein